MVKTRRRGAELEAAVYQATREILNRDGLSQLTFAKVATAAGTSKPVIYRHWETPFSLALLAIQDKIKADNHGPLDQVQLTGTNLHTDLVQVAKRFTASMDAFGQTFMSSWFEGLDHDESQQIQRMMASVKQVDINAINRVLKRAVDRKELPSTQLPEDVKLLLFDWLRYRMFAGQPVGERQIKFLVDSILIPVYEHAMS